MEMAGVRLDDSEVRRGTVTVTEALAVFPVPASIEVMVTVLFFRPAVVPVMSTEIVQEELTASVPPARLTDEAPAAAVIVPVQVVITLPDRRKNCR
jgi:hypothetical protein